MTFNQTSTDDSYPERVIDQSACPSPTRLKWMLELLGGDFRQKLLFLVYLVWAFLFAVAVLSFIFKE